MSGDTRLAALTPDDPAHRGAINDWTRSFASGLLLVIVGAFALAQPGVTEFLGSRFTGMILIAGGAGAAATTFPTTGSQSNWLDAIFGSLCALLGSLVLVEPFRETVPLVWMVAILLLFIGMLEIITAIRSVHQRGWVAIMGLFNTIAGLGLLLAGPSSTLIAIGFSFFVRGLFLVLLALHLRSAGHRSALQR